MDIIDSVLKATTEEIERAENKVRSIKFEAKLEAQNATRLAREELALKLKEEKDD